MPSNLFNDRQNTLQLFLNAYRLSPRTTRFPPNIQNICPFLKHLQSSLQRHLRIQISPSIIIGVRSHIEYAHDFCHAVNDIELCREKKEESVARFFCFGFSALSDLFLTS